MSPIAQFITEKAGCLPLGLLVLVGAALLYVSRRRSHASKAGLEVASASEKEDSPKTPATLGTVVPLENSGDWKTTEPLRLRPFKPKYHLTMALEATDVNNLIIMDKQYLERVNLRKKILAEHPSTVVGHLPGSQEAVAELYEFFTKTLLPVRWPALFSASSGQLHNHATGLALPVDCPPCPMDALRHITQNLQEDFLILQPSDDGDGYTLKAFSACFPSGFDTSAKMGLKLRDIHSPVPRYKEKLMTSMDRYFARLEVGKLVRRVNWSIMLNDELFTAFDATHFHDDEDKASITDPVDMNNVYQRTEMQTLFRLPHTKAIVFVIHTYMYPIQQVKDDGYGEDLAAAIEGLSRGSVPEIHFYKRAPVWAEKVINFLRS